MNPTITIKEQQQLNIIATNWPHLTEEAKERILGICQGIAMAQRMAEERRTN